MTRDDLVDLGAELRGHRRDGLGDADALVVGARVEAALVHEHDDRLDALLLEDRRPGRWRSRTSSLKSTVETPAGLTSGGRGLEGHADEADLGAGDLLDPGAGQAGAAAVLLDDVGGQPREVGAGIRLRRGSSTRRPGGSRRSACAAARSVPSSNSWLPTLLTSRPMALSDSTDGSSWNMPGEEGGAADEVARGDGEAVARRRPRRAAR